jgi:hypothetical protein
MPKMQKSIVAFLGFFFFCCIGTNSAAADSCFQGLSTIAGNLDYPAGWRTYAFEFTLYDGYGVQLDDTRDVVIYYRTPSYTKRIVDYSFEAATGKFEFAIPNADWDEDGYWISYTCSYEGTPVGVGGGGIETQYPGKVWSTDKGRSGDRIEGGAYSDTVHFFKRTGLPDDIDHQITNGYDCPLDLGPSGRAVQINVYIPWYYLGPNIATHRYLEVQSSCPYKVSCSDLTDSSDHINDQYTYWDPIKETWICGSSVSVDGECLADFTVSGTSGTHAASLFGTIHSCTIVNVTPPTIVLDYEGSPVTFKLNYASWEAGLVTLSADIP